MAADRTPLPADVIDELLSAELDGELDAAARDHGMTLDEAHAALAATPGTDARRAALGHAQTVSAGDALALDAVTRERLVRAARPRDLMPSEPRGGMPWARVVSIAAAIVIVVGLVGLTVSGLGSSSNKSSSKSSATTIAAAAGNAPAAVPTLGVVDSDADLEQLVQRYTSAPNASPENNDTSGAVVAPSTTAAGPPALPPSARGVNAAGSQCLSHLPPATAQGPRIVGYATHSGRIVAVAIAGGVGGPYAWAFDPTSCAIVLAAAGR
jgi:hypothetical protein